MLMLLPGETLDSERLIAECGSSIMANVHFLVDWVKETGNNPPDFIKPIWNDYMEFHELRAAKTRHQKLHESHYSYLDPEEACFITPDVINTFCIVGHPEEIVEKLRCLEGQGLKAINFIAPLNQQYRVAENFADKVVFRMK